MELYDYPTGIQSYILPHNGFSWCLPKIQAISSVFKDIKIPFSPIYEKNVTTIKSRKKKE